MTSRVALFTPTFMRKVSENTESHNLHDMYWVCIHGMMCRYEKGYRRE